MVGSGALPRDEREGRTRLELRGEDDLLEERRVDEARAGAREQHPSGCHEAHRQPVDVLVAAGRAIDVRALLREGGWIADDGIPRLPRRDTGAKVFEDVRAHEVGGIVGKPVRAAVLGGERQRFGGRVDVDGPRRSSGERRHRKGAGVGEEIQHRPASCDGPQPGAVVALVEEEAGLLTRVDVGEEAQPVLEKGRPSAAPCLFHRRLPRSRGWPVRRTRIRASRNCSSAAARRASSQRSVPSVERSRTPKSS